MQEKTIRKIISLVLSLILSLLVVFLFPRNTNLGGKGRGKNAKLETMQDLAVLLQD